MGAFLTSASSKLPMAFLLDPPGVIHKGSIMWTHTRSNSSAAPGGRRYCHSSAEDVDLTMKKSAAPYEAPAFTS